MAFSFRWIIDNVTGYPEKNGLNEVIATVSWMLEVRQLSDGSLHNKTGVTELLDPDPETFTEYLELSPEEILEWVWSTLEGGRTAFEEKAKAELIEMLNPSTHKETQFDMPWMTNCCPDSDPVSGSPGARLDGMDPATVVEDIRN